MKDVPFKQFGEKLKLIRKMAKESIDELSNAVEVDTTKLASIEAGKTQPEEDIVLLLINHFSLKDDEAIKMWELAGYAQEKQGLTNIMMDQKNTTQLAYLSPTDARILYTDIVHVNANKYGVILNFMQGLGANNQPMVISRVGMSHEHAQSFLKVLQQTLKISQNSPKPNKDNPK